MIKLPDEVVEAAARSLARYNCEQWDSDPERFWPHFADQARAAITAALNAWPGASALQENDSASIHDMACFILPLPQEARDE